MALRSCTPCDYDGICPYNAEYNCDCEYWCGADEPADMEFYYEEPDEYEVTDDGEI